MKKILVIPLLFLNLFAGAQRTVPDTTIMNVSISFTYEPAIFPSGWTSAPISAKAEAISAEETDRSKKIVWRALHKYPATLLKNNLTHIYYLKTMSFFDVGYGGTNSTDALYMTNNGVNEGYTDLYLEQNIHHEFSSILYRNYPKLFDSTAWKEANIPGFDYNDPEAGVGAIRNNQSSQDLDSLLSEKGFLTQYSLSSLENDINTIAQNLFCPAPGFWSYADSYPRINEKVKLLIRFYHLIDVKFTEAFFRKIQSPVSSSQSAVGSWQLAVSS